MESTGIQFKQLTWPLSPIQYWFLALTAPLIFMYFTWPASFEDMHTFWKAYSWYTIVGITQGLGHGFISLNLDKRLSWRRYPKARAMVAIITIVAYSVLAYVVVGTILALAWYDISFSRALTNAIGDVWIAVKISFAFAFVFATISFFMHWQKTRLEAERLQKELASHRYNMLKNQVNPHFLFNSLNVLSDLVHEDANLSEKYIQQLSKIYRYILDSSKHQIVPLTKELAFIESYTFLLKIRFGEKIKIHLDVEAPESDFIVPVSVQMLIENAVKHNQVTSSSPLVVRIFQEQGNICVRNTLRKRLTHEDSSGTGLDNLRAQYKLLANRPINVEQTKDFFKVCLPILHQSKKDS